MANQIKNARLQLRNDTAENWSSKNPVLLKGEVGIELGASAAQNKFKVGDGTTAWNDLGYTFDLAAIIAQIPKGGSVYELSKSSLEESDDTILATVDDPENGDVAVITTTVDDTEYEKSGYIYNGTAWVALSGMVDADKVIMREDITLAGNYTQIGNWTKTQNGTATKAVKGTSVASVIKSITTATLQPKAVQPSCSISLTGAGAKEVGTEFTPNYSVSFNSGSYTYGPATGVTVSSYAVSDTNSGSADTQTGSFTKFTVGDDTNYRCSVTVQHTAGVVAHDNLGGNSNPEVKIAAGSKSANSSYVTGFRAFFYGGQVSPIALDSAGIRGLTNGGAYKSSFSINIPQGCTQVVIALPNGHQVKTVADQNAFGTDIFSAFVKSTVQVEGLNSYAAAEYNVYTYTPAAALSSNTYNVTCS